MPFCVSIGRTPNVEGLNLAAANVSYSAKGVGVNDTLRTTDPNIYAAGDVALSYQFTHMADASARIVLQNALFPGPKKKLSNLGDSLDHLHRPGGGACGDVRR